MANKKMPEPWLSFFRDLDEQVSEEIRLELLGGFIITLVHGATRSTADIDAVGVTPRTASKQLLELAGEGSALHKKYKVYFDLVGVARLPEDYENRLKEIFPNVFNYLRLYALDPYDIALAKIERNIQRDRDDVKFLAKTVPFNLEILRDRYFKELRIYLGNPEREDLTLQLWTEMIEEDRNQK